MKQKTKRIFLNQKITEIEENISRFKKYYDYDGTEYRGTKEVGNLSKQPTDEDYYIPIRTISAFDNSYIEYESKGDKDKILLVKEYLNKIRPHLSDMIYDHETERKLKVHSVNNVID